MWPKRDCDLLRPRDAMGPPLSDTGSSDDCVSDLSWMEDGRGSRETVGVGLLVNVSETAALGRVGLVVRAFLSCTLV